MMKHYDNQWNRLRQIDLTDNLLDPIDYDQSLQDLINE